MLYGAVGEQIVMARQSGDDRFLGALTNEQAREIAVPLGFLGDGQWKVTVWQDGADAAQNAEDLATEELTVSAGVALLACPSG